MPKILHIIKTQRIAGAENHLFMLLSGLVSEGFDVSLLSLEDESNNRMSPAYREALEALASVDVNVVTEPVRHALDLWAVKRLRRKIQDLGPDLVHTHLMYADLFGALAARRAGVSHVIASRHHDYSFSLGDRLKFRVYYRLANRFHEAQIAISRRTADLVAEEAGAPSITRLIRYGCVDQRVDGDAARARLFKELDLAPDMIVMGTVARLIDWKGHRYALEALAILHEHIPNLIWLVVGEGPLRRSLERQVVETGLGDRVFFLGQRCDVPDLMAAMDVLMHPTTGEGFGLVFLEAMIQHTPIVATRTGAAPEIVVDGETGLLVSPRDPHALATGIRALATNRELRLSMGDAGRRRYETSFGSRRMIRETAELYRELLSDTD